MRVRRPGIKMPTFRALVRQVVAGANGDAVFDIHGRIVTPQEVSAEVLKKLKTRCALVDAARLKVRRGSRGTVTGRKGMAPRPLRYPPLPPPPKKKACA